MTITHKSLTIAIMVALMHFPEIVASMQTHPKNDLIKTTHFSRTDIATPYGIPSENNVKGVLDLVFTYLDSVTPAKLVNKVTNDEITTFHNLDKDVTLAKGDFRLIYYAWGVTYSGMLHAGEVTGNQQFTDYTARRMELIADLADFYNKQRGFAEDRSFPVYSVLYPSHLDDSGSMCAAMIKTARAGIHAQKLRPFIDNFIDFIHNKQFRLPDGTFARDQPQPNSLWLDDLYMSVPALAQMGKLTGNNKYFDDAVKQVLQFSERMFNKEKGLYMHGWVQHMKVHPQYLWARANGWAILAIIELLDVLPKTHTGYQAVVEQLQAHVKGLAACQSGTGLWHQLLDRNDTYLETSATAIFTYTIARAINLGLIDPYVYAPVAILGWNAVTTKVNRIGQIEGTCVGTGMGFDPAFYYNRPTDVLAAHGYGPVISAGAEIIRLIRNYNIEIFDRAVRLKPNSVLIKQ